MTDSLPKGLAEAAALRPQAVSIRSLLSDQGLGIEISLMAGGAGLDRQILHTRIQKSGLALAGHFHGIVPTRPQVLGQTELSYLARLSVDDRHRALRGYFALNLCCVIVTQGKRSFEDGASGMGALPVPELLECAEETGTPLLLSSERSSSTITALHALLDDRLAPRVRLHGVLVDVFGVGLLLIGSSGIGKSECALDLVMRGHRMVADDVVNCDYRPPGMVFGQPADLLRHHLEVRGLGILNIKDLFGVTAIRERKRIDVVVRLVEWSKDTEYDRLGLEDRYHVILGTKIRELVIPVRPARGRRSERAAQERRPPRRPRVLQQHRGSPPQRAHPRRVRVPAARQARLAAPGRAHHPEAGVGLHAHRARPHVPLCRASSRVAGVGP
ncbi:MAG: HPr(Ser) kinase/phosphatase [Polyangiaceae bacterium]|nr:HPr(Ser) kinase/phosphatase [Polyangiaceae bacterium]